MTIKKRLFLSNILMLIIPAVLSLLFALGLFYLGMHLLIQHGPEHFGHVYVDHREFEDFAQGVMVVLGIFAIICMVITNCFLTKFVFKKIATSLNILTEGVEQIKEGNLDYKIAYDGKDEFKPVCDAFNEMAARLKISVDKTQKDEQNRKELIAGISHDLRTPLTSIKAYVEGLLEGVAKTPEKQQAYMETILDKTNSLDAMVDKLFLFSKLDLGDFPFYPEKIDVKSDIEGIVDSYRTDYNPDRLTITTNYYSDDLTINFDSTQFKTAVVNVIENSIKYNDKDKTEINISVSTINDRIKLSITDNGPGVAEESLHKLFDVFWRSDASRNNPQKGSGLGLAITKKIWEHFGGNIWAENNTPTGLTVNMVLRRED